MDVERNPGPGPDHSYTATVQNLQSSMEWRFSQIMNDLQRHAADIGQKMDENLGRLVHTLGQLIEDTVGLKKAVQQDREDIRELQENTDNVQHRLDRLEQELHSLAADIIKNGRHGIQLLPDMIELFILLFADDIVLLSDALLDCKASTKGLQYAIISK